MSYQLSKSSYSYRYSSYKWSSLWRYSSSKASSYYSKLSRYSYSLISASSYYLRRIANAYTSRSVSSKISKSKYSWYKALSSMSYKRYSLFNVRFRNGLGFYSSTYTTYISGKAAVGMATGILAAIIIIPICCIVIIIVICVCVCKK